MFSKLLEKILKLRLVKFIKKTFQLDHGQYGFQKGSSTLGATVDLLEYVSGEMDKNKYVIGWEFWVLALPVFFRSKLQDRCSILQHTFM